VLGFTFVLHRFLMVSAGFGGFVAVFRHFCFCLRAMYEPQCCYSVLVRYYDGTIPIEYVDAVTILQKEGTFKNIEILELFFLTRNILLLLV